MTTPRPMTAAEEVEHIPAGSNPTRCLTWSGITNGSLRPVCTRRDGHEPPHQTGTYERRITPRMDRREGHPMTSNPRDRRVPGRTLGHISTIEGYRRSSSHNPTTDQENTMSESTASTTSVQFAGEWQGVVYCPGDGEPLYLDDAYAQGVADHILTMQPTQRAVLLARFKTWAAEIADAVEAADEMEDSR